MINNSLSLPSGKAVIGRLPDAVAALGALLAASVLLLLAPIGAHAVVLYDNGPVIDSGSSGSCDQGPSGCGGSGSWTYYDNFIISGDATMTGFDYVDWFDSGSASDYVTTNWSLFDSDPFSGGPIASGSDMAALTATGPANQYEFAISGLDIDLTDGVEYWLGINNTVANGAIVTVATVQNPGNGLNESKQSDGGVFELMRASGGNRAFTIHGEPVVAIPAPATAGLLALGLAAIGIRRRRSNG